MNLYPSILTDSVQTVQKQIDLLAPYSDKIQTVQIDIIDGEFADNLTITPIDLVNVDFHEFHIDFHLMVNEPDDFLFECTQLENVRSVIAQIERLSDQQGFIEELQKNNIQAGFSLDLYTPFEAVQKETLDQLSIIQFMSIHAGFQGLTFEQEKIIKKLHSAVPTIRKHENIEVLVDGGIQVDNFKMVLEAGVDGISVGSELWQSENLEKTIADFFNV